MSTISGLSRELKNQGAEWRKTANMHPCCGTIKMEHVKYSEWSAKKITLLTAEMATMCDTRSKQYKKLKKQKRSQEDRLMKRKREKD